MGHNGHGSADTLDRTSAVRTERDSSCVHSAHVGEPVRTGESSTEERDGQSVRTERTAPLRSPLGLGGAARDFTAHLLDASLARRWEDGEEWASNRCLADRYCGVTESVIRRWRSGEKSIPLAALRIFPVSLASELARAIVVDRGGIQRPLVRLRESLEGIDRPVSPDDRAEVMRALIDAQRRIGERLARLATEGR